MNTDILMTSIISTSMRERSLRARVTVMRMRMSACYTGIRTIRTFTIVISERSKVAPNWVDIM